MSCNEQNGVFDCGPCDISLGAPGERVIAVQWGGATTQGPNYRMFPSKEIQQNDGTLKSLAGERMGMMGVNERVLNFNTPPRRGDALRQTGRFQNQDALIQMIDCLDEPLAVGDRLDIIGISPYTHWLWTYWDISAAEPGVMFTVRSKFGGEVIGDIDASVESCGMFAALPGADAIPADPGDPAAVPPVAPTPASPAVPMGHFSCDNEVIQLEITGTAARGGLGNVAIGVAAAVICPRTGK